MRSLAQELKHKVQYTRKLTLHLLLIEGKETEDHLLPCSMVYRESCGCQSVEDGSVDIVQLAETLKNKYVTEREILLKLFDKQI